MTITKLLGGVAVAALIAGSANAQVTLASSGDIAYPLRVTGPLGDANATVGFIVSEFQPAAAADQLKGNIVITPSFAALTFQQLEVAQRLSLQVELTNAGWGVPAGGSVTAAAAAGGTTEACSFTTAASAGGGTGNKTVTFLSTGTNGNISGCSGIGDTFTFPNVTRTANGSPVTVKFTYTQIAANGSAVANAKTFTKSIVLADVKPSWATVGADHKVTVGKVVVPSDGKFAAVGAVDLGEIQVSFAGTANPATTGPAGTFKAILDSQGGALDVSDDLVAASGSNLVLTFPQGTSGFAQTAGAFTIAGTAAACGIPVTTTAPAQTVTCTLTGGDVENLVTKRMISGTKVIDKTVSAQTVTAALNVTSKTSIASLAGPSGNLAVIDIDDGKAEQALGADDFRWVAFGAGATESQFRVSGMTQAQTDAITEIRVKAAKGGNNNVTVPSIGYFALSNTGDPSTGFRISGRTISFNSKALGLAAGLTGTTTGNADISAVELQYTESVFTGTNPVTAGAIIRRQIANRNPTSIVAVPVSTD